MVEISFEHNQIDGWQRQTAVNSNKVSYWNGLYLILGLLLCCLSLLPFLVVPQNNDIKFWQKRNEVSSITARVIPDIFGYSLLETFHIMFDCKLFFKLDSVMTFPVFIRLYIGKLIGFVVVPKLTAYLIWNLILGYDSVMPFNVYLGLIGFPIPYMVLWYQYPLEFQYNKRGRRKFKAYFYYKTWLNFTFIPLLISTIIVGLLPDGFDWVVAVEFPIHREFLYFLTSKFLAKSTGILDESSQTIITIQVNIGYAFKLVAVLGTKASELTSFCIIAVDFMLNLKSCWKIFRLHGKVNPDPLVNQIRVIEMKKELQKLCLIEIIEMMVPISYIITFLIAYHGPNADLFGNVQSNYWHYKPVEDVTNLTKTVFALFLVDLSSGGFGGILLSTVSINLLQEGIMMLKTHWPLITVSVASALHMVSPNASDINRFR